MTEIPGTGKPSYELEKEKKETVPVPLSVVNVSEIKRIKTDKPQPGDNLWFNQLKSWILISLIPSVIFVILGIFLDWKFILMVPAWPVIALLTWQVRRLIRRFEKNVDVLAK